MLNSTVLVMISECNLDLRGACLKYGKYYRLPTVYVPPSVRSSDRNV